MKTRLITFCMLAMALSVHANDKAVLQTMKKATEYMMNVASYHGGFVWNYLPDYSRQWGEIEAKRTMIWMQSPGTPDVGEVLLDAYHATNDEYYYQNACRVADALEEAQLPCGGWNYMYNFEPEDSTKEWYNTIGKQAWRLEEFQHYYGNATFDDEVTSHSAKFILRLYLEKKDSKYLEPLKKTIDFIIRSQYKNGGWPQRFPLMYDHPFKGKADYTSFVTINDNVIPENIDFLLECYSYLNMKELQEPILRAMNCMLLLQQGEPYAGWADQYTSDDLMPAHARSYEPRAVNGGTTIAGIFQMMKYYTITGDSKYLNGIPSAIKYLESMALTTSEVAKSRQRNIDDDEILIPRFIDPDNGKPLYVHRSGSNVMNGNYYTDEDISNTIGHYSSTQVVNIGAIKDAYKKILNLNLDSIKKNSPFNNTSVVKPIDYYYEHGSFNKHGAPLQSAEEVVKSINKKGYWLTTLGTTSHPYKAIPKSYNTQNNDSKEYETTMVGDEYDTSPYPDNKIKGISTRTYINNMLTLIEYLKNKDNIQIKK